MTLRITKRLVLRLFTLLVTAFVIAGITYEQVGAWRDQKRFPRIGQSVDIGGRSLNLFCSGQGNPAVIFDTGASSPGCSWLLVQPEVARFTRAC